MSAKSKNILVLIFLIAPLLFFAGCTKENFVEPIDPFQAKPLQPDAPQFQLGTGTNALILKANKENIASETDSLVRIKGALFVENSKYGDIRLSNGDFELINSGNSGDNIFNNFRGYAVLNIPQEGFFQYLNFPEMIAMPIGLKKGSEFETESFNWPVNEDRYYFYYENPNPFPINISSSKLENIKKIAIDPTDPYFFASGDIEGTKLGDLSDVGFAFSAQGLIPFSPLVSLKKMPIEGFYGNIYLSGTIPIGDYPVSVSAEGVLKFTSDEMDDAKNFFEGRNSDFALGLNGQVNFDNEALDWMGIEVVLGQATLVFAMDRSGKTLLKFAGIREDPPMSVSDFLKSIITKDYDFLDYLAPYQTKEVFYGSIGNELSDWKMGFKFESKLNLPNDFSIDMGHVYLYLDPTIMNFEGEVVLAGFSHIGMKGTVEMNGNFALTGYAKAGFSASYKALSLSFQLGVDVTLAHRDGVVSFEGNFTMSGKASLDIKVGTLTASFTIHGSCKIASDGSFKLCFSIGIGDFGFDVCLSFNAQQAKIQGKNYHPEMHYKEIPLEQVPIQNRFPAEKSMK